MPDKHFTHLHLHTDYSLLDGAITIEKLIDHGKQHNYKALAISDHGNIFGAVKFFQKCVKAGIKPILGVEAYICNDRALKNSNEKYYHLLLLVQNDTGYKNLCKLLSRSYTEGFYFKPRIDYSLLEEFNEGLIATSTCIGGHIPQLFLHEKHDEAYSMVERMASMFKDRYYLEVQPATIDKQAVVNKHIFELEKHFSLPLFASGDCHYPSAEDRYAHEVMLAVQTRTTMDDPKRMTFGDCRAHMRTVDEMLEAFPSRPDAIWRTGEIADRCNFSFATGKLFFPNFELPKETTANDYFSQKCKEGLDDLYLKKRFPVEKKQEYYDRLQFECDMISEMGFAPYFLVVSDFILWAKQNGIAVGPGRGSVAGSLVAWALSITDVDPIKYNLLFERFLNPERVSMPDIDIDFCIEGRERVIDYVREKYGHDHVGQIITFGTMMAKGVIKDVARALGIPFEEANAITELIPDELKITLKDALEREPRLANMCKQNERIEQLFDIAMRLEGTTRHASKHAAGIVISPEPIEDVLPIYVPPRTKDIVTQYAMTELESLGFLKMDFLGLKNLTLITRVVELIKKNHNVDLDIEALPLDDEKTIELLAKGLTLGVFQFESDGLRDVLCRLKPTTFEDAIAVNALYRPGPLGSGMVDDFIDRKHGKQKITYIFPELEEILKETYGVIVYQEQVMKIASAIGGYSLGEADILRRAMGKKKVDVMAEQKEIFMSRAVEKGFDKKKSDELFELMAYFAGYGFNKSHSTAYALIAYQTAYLKAHYPVEFMSVLISLDIGNPDSMVLYISEARSMKIPLFPPDITKSHIDFYPEDKGIRFGLRGVKNVGGTALESIINARGKKNIPRTLAEFCSNIDLRVCNKRVLESLIFAGALDCLSGTRAAMLENLDLCIEYAQDVQEGERTGQQNLFGSVSNESSDQKKDSYVNWKAVEEFPVLYMLEKEKEVLGIYVSQHPLDTYKETLSLLEIHSIKEAQQEKLSQAILVGTLTSLREITTKKGDPMAFGVFEDYHDRAELIIFPKIFKKYGEQLKKESFFIVVGDAQESQDGGTCKVKVQKLMPLSSFDLQSSVKKMSILLSDKAIELDSALQEMQKVCSKSGSTQLTFEFKQDDNTFVHRVFKKITISKDMVDTVNQFDKSIFTIKCQLL